MLFFINDRFLLKGQRLRALLLAPEMGAVATRTDVAATDLRAEFSLIDNQQQVVMNGEWRRPYDGTGFAHLRVPFSYGELETDKLSPGAYDVRAANGSVLAGRSQIVVLDSGQYGAFAKMTAEEKTIDDGSPLENADGVIQAWLQSWQELFSYLGTVSPQHLFTVAAGAAAPPATGRGSTAPQATGRGAVAPQATQISLPAAALRQLKSESFRWASFHLNRLTFDQLFYGGTVRLEQGPSDGQASFRLVLQYRVKPQAELGKEYIDFLRQMLQDQRFLIDLAWNVVPPTGTFAYQAHLDTTWRFSGSGVG